MSPLLLYPMIPAVIGGIINWLYWRRKGYSSVNQLILGILVFYAGFYLLFKYLFY